jgi:uncharacterized protein (DUF2235 family)
MALYAFDGTWNEAHDAGEYGRNTNVVKFLRAYGGVKDLLQSGDHEPDEDAGHYTKGIGTRHGTVGKLLGGAFGVGGRRRISRASEQLRRRFAAGDTTVDIIGFSRGAALAIHFANGIKGIKLVDARGERVRPRVRFLGLWDLVAAFGIPIDLGPIGFQRINLGYKLQLPEHVDHCFHAVALDERRRPFRFTRVDGAYQVWFRGVHSDVGGGNDNVGLNDIALAWMLRKATAVGLPITAGAADGLTGDPGAAIKPAKADKRGGPRDLRAADCVHYSVSARRTAECLDPPERCPRETEADELRRVSLLEPSREGTVEHRLRERAPTEERH